ncbi:hypothetical protein ACFO1B_32730 [Dactylosporangium siamense]|uniref:Uncharacterized protein n=1 Tax=Dactylosporangium siamense TaxID=685454 RepID=A0A919UC06_9ACTN|nr:hypothetical protein [Dactylosporangium siamense]GIG46211.1 hypothetical protein Dsi01nite_042520 [Dactylosporangium siamense]
MPPTGFWRAVLVNLARTDAPFKGPAAEPSPLLIALARQTPAFQVSRPATGRWWRDLPLALARVTPSFAGDAPSPSSAPSPSPAPEPVAPRRPVRPGPPTRWRPALAAAGAFASVAVAVLTVTVAAAWLARGTTSGPGGVGATPRPTGSPVVVAIPGPVDFVPVGIGTRVVVEGSLSGTRVTKHLDLGPVQLEASLATAYSALILGQGLAGAPLTAAAQEPADCLEAIQTDPYPAEDLVEATKGARFCVVAPPTELRPARVVRVAVQDVAANGSVTILYHEWDAVPVFRFTLASVVVPRCLSVTGVGAPPAKGRVVLFVNSGNAFFYEAALTFLTDGTWTVPAVIIGDERSGGLRFVLHAVQVSDEMAQELAAHDGAPYAVTALQGTTLARAEVTRSADTGTC